MSPAHPPMSAEAIRKEVQEIDWWHQIDLGQGIVTPGRGGSTQKLLERVHLPEDFTGKTVLDIGAWDGALSFEAERRGAARVVALNIIPKPGLEFARKVLGSKVESMVGDLMRGAPDQVGGPFDVVIFSGVLYHLPNMIEALRRVYDLTAPSGLMICETDTRLNYLAHPAAALVEDERGVTNYARNWWHPNWRAVVSMCRQVGYSRAEIVAMPDTDRPSRVRKALRHMPLLWRLAPEPHLRCVAHAWR